MDLDLYISDLLYRYECVTVPGLGAFLSHRTSAKLNPEEQCFFPPSKRISFNAQVNENDGLLAKYISRSASMSYEDAMRQIQSSVQSLKSTLDKNQPVILKQIGTMRLNEDRAIVFEPNNEINYLTESFGLSRVAAEPVTREIALDPDHSITEDIQSSKKIGIRRTPWRKYAAVGLLALGLSGTMGYMYIKDIESYNVAEKQRAEQQLENQIQEATFSIKNPLPTITLNAFKPHGNYHIVAGAFRKKENAQVRVDQLRDKGYKARQIGANRFGLHQVVYGSYSDPKEALSALREVRKSDNRGAWMLVKDLEEKTTGVAK